MLPHRPSRGSAYLAPRCAASFGRVDSSLNRICQSSASSDLKIVGGAIAVKLVIGRCNLDNAHL
jgi:hypothetical protein